MKISQCSIDFYTIVPYGKHQKVVSNVSVGILRKIIIIAKLE